MIGISDDLDELRTQILLIESVAGELIAKTHGFPAVNRNLERIRATCRILKLNLETPDAGNSPPRS
jgi:hypothetical protein